MSAELPVAPAPALPPSGPLPDHGGAPGASPPFGILAEFPDPAALVHACERVREAGYSRWDSHAPFPVRGIDEAMGLRASIVPWFSLVFGFGGAGLGWLLQVWVSASASPLVISGKPLVSWPAFVPVAFETGVLCCAIGTLLGLAVAGRLPRLYHALFRSEAFERASDDAFFISIEAEDPRFDLSGTAAFLRDLGATRVELVDA